jgi:hypothetical protein
MMTLTIPDDIERQLKVIAQQSHLTPAELVLSLLKNAVSQPVNEPTPVSCFDLMQEGLGCIEDAPGDLSVNKRHFEGYGQ